MASHGFVELQDGSDASLRRILTLSCRWSRVKQIYIWPVGLPRQRVEDLLREVMAEHGGRVAQVEIVESGDHDAAVAHAKTASFCVLSSSLLASHIRDEQVAVFFPSWKEASAPAPWQALTGD